MAKNTKQIEIPINPGCIPDLPDPRDIHLEEVMGAVSLPDEYDITSKLRIEEEHQNGSSSCVGQAWAYYAEVLERKENNNYTNLSARDIYSQIYLPQGGAYIREGAKIMTNKGISLETHLPSYKVPNLPPSEEFMRSREDVTEQSLKTALTYKSKLYASIWHKENITTVKQAIFQNHGVVTGVYGNNANWSKPKEGVCVPPIGDPNPWGHALFLVGWKGDFIKFINSWGKDWGLKGYGYLAPSYFGSSSVFSVWSLVDLPNDWQGDIINMFKLIRKAGDKKVWAINNSKRFWVLDPETLERGRNGAWLSWDDIIEDDPSKYTYGGAIFIAKPDDPT